MQILKDDLLPIQPLIYEFSVWFHRKYIHFPQRYKYVVGQQIAEDTIELLALINEARYSPKKAHILRKAQILLEKLRWRFRLAKDLECMSLGDYEKGARKMVEIGSMLGGWEKFAKSVKPKETKQAENHAERS